MRRDKRAPALYELMRPRPKGPTLAGSAPSTYARPSDPAPETDDALSWLSPGRVMRVPVGYVFVAIVLVLALMIGGFMAGYKKRQKEEDRQRALAVQQELDGVSDPLADTRPASLPAAGSQIAGRPEPQAPSAAPSSQRSGAIPGHVTVVRAPSQDPRAPDLNYVVAARLSEEEALRAANFLAGKGLEIVVVPVDNRSSTWHVVVARGFGSDEWYGPDGKRLERDLQAFGREYKRDHKGPVDFSDAWWQKFK